jgi:hypothetical protein
MGKYPCPMQSSPDDEAVTNASNKPRDSLRSRAWQPGFENKISMTGHLTIAQFEQNRNSRGADQEFGPSPGPDFVAIGPRVGSPYSVDRAAGRPRFPVISSHNPCPV